MALESVDFQAQVHQQVTRLIESWRETGFSEDDVQEAANQFFHMGLIASQQVQQEGGVTPEGMDQMIPFTEESGGKVVHYFLEGLHLAILKVHEERLPSQEKWQIMQNVAFHVYEQSKQVVIATLGQENTPDVQISDDQILGWLGQTAVEAMLYYLGELEKQNGPIPRLGDQDPANLLNMAEDAVEEEDVNVGLPLPPEPAETPIAEEAPPAPPEPALTPTVAETPADVPTPPVTSAVPELHHKYAAVSLFLSTMSSARQAAILETFKPEEQAIINQYRDPDVVVQHLDLDKVSKYLRRLKEKMGTVRPRRKSPTRASIARDIARLSHDRLERLFYHERPIVRGYVSQLMASDNAGYDAYQLPSGVEDSLRAYLHRNFPKELVRS